MQPTGTFEEKMATYAERDRIAELEGCFSSGEGRRVYRGLEGGAYVEYTYDPDTEEVVNGSVRPIDISR